MNFSSIMKGIGTGMLILTPFLNADAVRLSPEQALRRVEGTSTRFRIPGNATYRLAHTESVENEPMLYVFNKGTDGFVITSADDALPALLGYSDAGAFDPEEASPELKWWLGQYADEAAWGLENGPAAVAVSSAKSKATAPRADIPEMLTSRWNQDAPFNLDCPKLGSQQCVTGCVATAMAQVIRYHGYPVQGSGEYSYQWNGKVLDFNYGATTFNYADMLDVYDSGSTPEQRQAVAALMYACGVSVNMSYSPVESGASDMYVPYALKTFFNYDAGTRLLNRNSFTTEEWEDLVYGELSEGRPVIYGGQAPAGGHEFVCDGYENGYFHINWGWAGMGNGYFLLSALDPGLQGIGGFAGGYNSNQTMIYGAAPSPGGTPWYPIYATGSLGYSNYQAPFKAVDIEFISGGVHNYSPEAVEVSFRLRCVSDSGSEFFGDPRSISFRGAVGGSAGGYKKFTMQLPPDLAEGNYKVYLGFETPEGNWQDVLCPLTVASYFNLTSAPDGSYSFSEGEPAVKSKLRVTAFAPASAVLSGEPTRFDMTVENIGEVDFSNAITIRVYDKGIHTESLAAHRIGLDIGPGEVFNGYVYLSYTLPDGDYDVIVYDQYEEAISDVFPLYIGVPPVMVDRVILDTTDVSMEVESTLQLTATVLPEDAVDKSLIWSSSNPEVANVDQSGMVTAFTPGTAIITVKSAANEDIAASCLVIVNDNSWVDAVEGGTVSADIYTVNGVLVKSNADSHDISNLAKGAYIIRIGKTTHKILK